MNRKYLRIPLLLLALGLFATGCGGDDAPTNPGGGGGGGGGGGTGVNMSATVDGGAWQAVTAYALDNAGIVAIGSANAGGDIGIGFGFQKVGAGTGTYTIGPGLVPNANITSLGGTSWSASGANGSGTIVVTTLTADRIAGTFAFTAVRITGAQEPATRTVTNGTFDLSFME